MKSKIFSNEFVLGGKTAPFPFLAMSLVAAWQGLGRVEHREYASLTTWCGLTMSVGDQPVQRNAKQKMFIDSYVQPTVAKRRRRNDMT